MNHIDEFLLDLGLGTKERKVYMSLLSLNEQPASVIAKKIKIPRSTTLFILNELAEKGFVTKRIHDSNTSYFSAITPTEIKNLLNHKKEKLEAQLRDLEILAPEFKNIAKNFLPHSKVGYYEGLEGAYKMIDLACENDSPVYFISAHKLNPKISNYVRSVYVPKRKKMKSKCQMIVVKNQLSVDYISFASGVYEWVGFVDQRKSAWKFESTIAIYDNKIQLHSFDGDFIGGVVIENEYLASTMMSIFNLLKTVASIEVSNKKLR